MIQIDLLLRHYLMIERWPPHLWYDKLLVNLLMHSDISTYIYEQIISKVTILNRNKTVVKSYHILTCSSSSTGAMNIMIGELSNLRVLLYFLMEEVRDSMERVETE